MSQPFDAAELDGIRKTLALSGEDPGALEATPISAGRSNLTALLSDGSRSWVLRTPPRVGRTPSAHDVAREFRVTEALHRAGFPVARPVVLCEDESVLGGPFAIAEYVAGRCIQTEGHLAALSDDRVRQTTDALIRTFADLHSLDHVELGLETFARPSGYAARQLRRWAGQWQLVSPGDEALDAMADDLVGRFSQILPEQRRASVVHGDFRIDNVLVDLMGSVAKVAAVVDWELSTLGDPIADVAMMCAYRNAGFDLVLGFDAAWTSPRLPKADQLASQYAEMAGVDLDNWEFHLALAYFKIAVISAGIAHRRRASAGSSWGRDSAADAVEPFLAAALDALGT